MAPRRPARRPAVTLPRARALGAKYGAKALRKQFPSAGALSKWAKTTRAYGDRRPVATMLTERVAPAAFERMAYDSPGSAADIISASNHTALNRAFRAGVRKAVGPAVRAKTPAKRRAPKRTRNPAARKYRTRQYNVSEWNVRAQRWEALGRAEATTPKYAIEEFMASHPGYSRLHLRAEEVKAPTKRTRNPGALTPAKVKALGAGFGAKAARALVKGQSVGDLEMDERVHDRPLLAVLLDDAEQYATAYLDDMEDGDVTMAMENAPNSKALWSAFSRGVASTAKPVLVAFIADGRARVDAVVNPSPRRRRPARRRR